MTVAIEIVPINLRDVLFICENMRQQDWEEVLNLLPKSVRTPDVVAMICMQSTKVGFVAKSNGVPAGVIQMGELIDGTWRIGMFGTSRLPEVALALAGRLSELVPEMIKDGARYCEAYSDTLHEEAHKFLRFIGFRKRAILPGYGSHGRDFALFIFTKDDADVFHGRWRKLHTSGGASISAGDGRNSGATGVPQAEGQPPE